MASILSVPPEIMTNILKLLNPFDIESAARTLNSRVYYPAVPLIKPRQSWIANARAMCELFKESGRRRLVPSYPGHIPVLPAFHLDVDEIPRSRYEDFGLNRGGGPYLRSSPPDLQSWMKLDGSFDWLEPLEDNIAAEMGGHNGFEGGEPPASKSKVDGLVAQAEKLGLTLPIGFESFFRSDRYHFRIPSMSAWYFALGKLVKCPPSIDDHTGGYILRFYCDQQYCAFSYLYLSPSGHHCVLQSMLNLYEEMGWSESDMEADADEAAGNEVEEVEQENEKDLPEISKNMVSMVALTLEEYLVMVYFEELMEFGARPFKGLCDYVQHTYLSPVDVEYLKKSCPDINTFLRSIRWKGKRQYDRSISPDLWP